MKPIRLGMIGLLSGLALTCGSAWAEAKEVRIVRQIGLGYLPLYIAQEKHLIEKHAALADLKDVTVTYLPLATSTAINNAVLANDAEFAGVGVPPFLVAWDKTRGNLDIRAVAALNGESVFLNSVNPAIQSVKDFTDRDRIALPAPKVSLQAIILAMAAEQAFGEGHHDALDHLVAPLGHADGLIALLSPRSEITSHLSASPFQYEELKNKRVHRVFSSRDVIGGPATFSVLYTTGRFRDANPKLVQAVAAAIAEAVDLIKAAPIQAAEIYIKADKPNLSVEHVRDLIVNPENSYSTTPHNIVKYADFMAKIGINRNRPASWRELFFAETREGS